MYVSINKLVTEYINQQMHLVIYNKLQIMLRNSWKVPLLLVSSPECHLQGVYSDAYHEFYFMMHTFLY